MEHASEPTSADLRASIDCAAALGSVNAFAAGQEARVSRAELRTHLERCTACREAYHAAVNTVARLARARREAPEETDSPPRVARGVLGGARRQRRKLVLSRGQGLVLIFGFVAMVLFLAPTSLPAGVALESLGGVAWAGSERLEGAGEHRALERNASCMTTDEARARIDAGGARVVLEPKTAVAIERVRPFRMRLFEGTLLVSGSCVITGRSAVIEARDGDGWIDDDGASLRVGVARGSFSVTDIDGEHLVPAGSVWVQRADSVALSDR